MYLIRRFEEGAEEAYMRGLIHGTMHLSIGQEASAVGSAMALRKTDYITSTHRGHGHCIAKGADPKRMFAEFFGKEDGYCRGRGGSMHIADVAKRQPRRQRHRRRRHSRSPWVRRWPSSSRSGEDVVVCFFGDGANNEGAFHEALNMAVDLEAAGRLRLREQQVRHVDLDRAVHGRREHRRPRRAYSMPGVIVDGNRIADVAEAVRPPSPGRAPGEGPTLVECKTYRTRGHSKSDRNRYRTKEEIEDWKLRDPIGHFETELVANGIATAEEVAAISAAAMRKLLQALTLPATAPTRRRMRCTRDVYTPGSPA